MKNLFSSKTKFGVLVIVLTFCLYSSNAQSYTLTDEDVVVENGIILSCSYDFELKSIIIPETLDGQTVIGTYDESIIGVFRDKGISSVELPSTIEFIGRYTFYGNNISNLDLSGCTSLIAIGEYAFSRSYINSVELPSTIEVIGSYAFEGNSISILDLSVCTALITIGQRGFSSNSIESLNMSNCNALTTIDISAFYNNKIANVDLSSCTALVSIGASAFMSNSITEVDITDCTSLLWIGHSAFRYNPLAGIALPEVIYDETVYNIWKDGNNKSYTAGTDMATDMTTLYAPFIQYTLTDEDVVMENGIIMSCSYDFEVKNIIIPEILDGQTVISTSDFSINGVFYNKGITSVELPSTIKIIGKRTFWRNHISNLDISDCTALVSIGEGAFSENSIDSLDFSNCTALSTIGSRAFYGNRIVDADLTSCNNLLSVGSSAFSNNPSVHDFALPDPVIAGYYYSNWIDSEGILHDPVDRVSNLTTSYKRIMPEITDIVERYGPTSGNTEITITGKNFEDSKNNKKILFDEIEALSYNFWSDTLITITSPPQTEGAAKIKIPLDNNIIYSSPKQYYYTDEDVIPVCGNISGTWEVGGTYLLTCNVTIPENSTLIINEGVKIIAMPEENILLSCFGILKGNGTYDNPILFTSANNVPGSWKGININGTNDNCKFNNCIFEYAETAISLYAWAFQCESHRNYSEFINCVIRNNSNNAFSCTGEGDLEWGCTPSRTGACSPLIQNCLIYNNVSNGIELTAYDGYKSNGYIGARIYNNLIYNNRNGIYCQGDDNVEPKIINNVISKNSVAGIYSTHYNFDKIDFNIANNIIANNGIGIINEDTTSIILYNNGFWSNTVDVQGETEDSSNIFEDPLFADLQNNDYNLQSNSPCIDAGSNEYVDFDYDFENKSRIWDGNNDGTHVVDIGAYEYDVPCYFLTEDVSICEGETYEGITESGTHQRELETVTGCDSIVITNLTVFPIYESEEDVTLCEGEIYNGWSVSGTYADTLASITGCDSIIVTRLTVLPSYQPDIIINKNTLSTTATFQSYKWYKNDGNILVGTESEYTITESGEYYLVVADENGCTNTSVAVNMVYTSVYENTIEDFNYSIIPNPNKGKFTFRIISGTNEEFRLKLINTMGQVIEIREIKTPEVDQVEQFEMSYLSKGIYHLVISSDKFYTSEKIVIQ